MFLVNHQYKCQDRSDLRPTDAAVELLSALDLDLHMGAGMISL